MNTFLLAEKCEFPYGDGMLVIAQNEERARKLAARTFPRLVAPDGKNLWESNETACVPLGECPTETLERAIMRGSILCACAIENGNIYNLRLRPDTQAYSKAL